MGALVGSYIEPGGSSLNTGKVVAHDSGLVEVACTDDAVGDRCQEHGVLFGTKAREGEVKAVLVIDVGCNEASCMVSSNSIMGIKRVMLIYP